MAASTRRESHELLRSVAASRCSAYDCECVALALQLGVPLLTGDGEILDQFARWLAVLLPFLGP